MIIIPELYLRNGNVVLVDGTTSPIFKEDALATANTLKSQGADALYCKDLSVTALGESPNFPVIKKILNDTGLAVYIGGAFRTMKGIDACISAGVELVVLGAQAYQDPAFLSEACQKFPGRIAVSIEVKGGKVTIPGYAVAPNKTEFDYAEQFLKAGVRFIFYSNMPASGRLTSKDLDQLSFFCKKVIARIVCTTEIYDTSDIENIAKLGVPRLDGVAVGRALYEGRIDLHSAVTMLNDLSLASGDEATLTEM